MARISSAAANMQLINRMLGTQNRAFDLHTQVTSKKKSQDYAGIARDAQRLLNIENSRDQLKNYNRGNQREQTRLSVASTAVEAIRKAMERFNEALSDYNLGRPRIKESIDVVQSTAFHALRDIEDLLNTEVNGRFLFAGSRTTTEPVNFNTTSISEFQNTFDGARVIVPETRDAQLQNFSFNKDILNEKKPFIDDTNFLQFRRDGNGDTTDSNAGTIRASSAIFSNLTAGTTITITNTAHNNGTYTVDSVSEDGTTATVRTEQLTDEFVSIPLRDEESTTPVTFLFNVPVPEDDGTVTRSRTSEADAAAAPGRVTFDRNARTITGSGTNAELFQGLKAGDFVTISGSGNNNFTVEVESVSEDGSAITIVSNPTDITLADGTIIETDDPDRLPLTEGRSANGFTGFTFNREENTIVANGHRAVFAGVKAGETINVAGTAENDGNYTVASVSEDGKTATIVPKRLTDEGFAGNRLSDRLFDKDIEFTNATNTIEVFPRGGDTPVPGIFSDLEVGQQFTITNAANTANNGTYTIASIAADGSSLTVQQPVSDSRDTDGVNFADADNVPANESLSEHTFFDQPFGTDIKFTTATADAGNTIQVSPRGTDTPVPGIFSHLAVGQQFTITDAANDANNGTFTVASVARDGSSVTVKEPVINETDADGVNFARVGKPFAERTYRTDIKFTDAGNTIQAFQFGTDTPIPDMFRGLTVGQQFTVTGAANDPNNGTFTIASIAEDGSSLTVEENIRDEPSISGVGFTRVNKPFYISNTEILSPPPGGDPDTVRITNAPATYDGLMVGQTITLSGAGGSNGTFTIAGISPDKSSIVISDPDDIVTNANLAMNTARLQVFGTGGTITATSYYSGDDQGLTHRVDDDREFVFDIQANDPAFEKAVRAMKIILQGKFGTEGGLDQNLHRVDEAKYLINAALDQTVNDTAPFGPEAAGSIEEVERTIGFDKFLIKEIDQFHQQFIGFLEQDIANLENADPLESITKLLDEGQVLNASYQAFARIRQLSLTNFL